MMDCLRVFLVYADRERVFLHSDDCLELRKAFLREMAVGKWMMGLKLIGFSLELMEMRIALIVT